jgi:hypothetical protein
MTNLTIFKPDFEFLLKLEGRYLIFTYLSTIVKNILFCTLIFLIFQKPAYLLKEYRIYICLNIITTYICGLINFLWQPIILMPSFIFCGNGPLKFLGPYFTLIMGSAYVYAFLAHVYSYLICVLYQYAHVDLGHSYLMQVFYNKWKPIFIYGMFLLGIYLGMPVIYIWCEFDFAPERALEDKGVLYRYLSKLLL